MSLSVGAAQRPAIAADSTVTQSEAERVAVVAKVTPAVVAIFSPGGAGGGSGVLITADGLALTNFHVTSGAGNFMKCGLADGVLYDAVIVGIDPTGDVALIKLVGRDDFPHVEMGDSDTLQSGDYTFAMGNPFLLATDFAPTVTYGIVSGVHRYQEPAGTFLEYTDCIQVDTSINPGNSGGPLFSATGLLVGINGRGSFEKRGRVNSGAGYAISINQIKNFTDALRGGLIVDHATLGATVATKDDGSVVVASILDKSEVYRRGLREDDEIVSFAGRPIRSVNQFKNVLGIYPKGWKLPLVYRRDGRKQEVFVRLRGLHRQSELTLDKSKKAPEVPQPRNRPRRNPPGGKPEGQPGQPPGPNKPQRPAAPKPPEHVAKLFAERPGFANYFFNEIERDRVLKGLAALGDYSKETGVWKIGGTIAADESPFEFKLGEKLAGLTLDDGKKFFVQELGVGEFKDEPPETGGLMLAMHQFRQLLIYGHQGFSEFYYQGSEPLDGNGPMVDVLFCERYGARSHWYLSRETGLLVGFDTYRDDDVDPCEVRCEGLAELSGRRLPAVMTVVHAGREYARFKPTAANFGVPLPDAVKTAEPSGDTSAAESKTNTPE
ncbi:MAG: PDZ domain-containing protein [Planctomycetaceae bacterium]|nr:PDZ domain-containing protein [Planctomycetaceae bacterium]